MGETVSGQKQDGGAPGSAAGLKAQLRWPDGRPIETWRVNPEYRESARWPDWCWAPKDFDLGDPCHGYFATEAEALADARRTIEERHAEMTFPSMADVLREALRRRQIERAIEVPMFLTRDELER